MRVPTGDAWEGLAAMRLVAVNLQPSEPDGLRRAAESRALVPRVTRSLPRVVRHHDIPEPDDQLTTDACAFTTRVPVDPTRQLRTPRSLAMGGR